MQGTCRAPPRRRNNASTAPVLRLQDANGAPPGRHQNACRAPPRRLRGEFTARLQPVSQIMWAKGVIYDIMRPHVEHARCGHESQFARDRTNIEREGSADATRTSEALIERRQRATKAPVGRQHSACRAPRRRGQGGSPARLQHTALARCLDIRRTSEVLNAGCGTPARRVHVAWMVEGHRKNLTPAI